jgi:hypothetical protein
MLRACRKCSVQFIAVHAKILFAIFKELAYGLLRLVDTLHVQLQVFRFTSKFCPAKPNTALSNAFWQTVFTSRTVVCVFVCLFPWASAASHGCTAACWLIVPPALNVPTLAARCPRAYRRVPHSNGGSWNLWAGNRTGSFA